MIALAACSPFGVRAYELHSVEATHEAARYHVRMAVTLDVPADAAYSLFIDPENLPLINPAVKKVQALRSEDGSGQRLYTDVRLCVSVFCRHLEQVQEMRYEKQAIGGSLHARVIAELSDLHYGVADWQMRDCDGRTCLEFVAELEPKFWIPPFVGPWLVQRKLRSEAMQTSEGIERLVRERHGPR